RFRARRSGGRGRPAHGPRGPLDDAQPNRRRARHRPRRPGREPVRRDEIARRVRDAGRNDSARRAPRARVVDARPGGAASARRPRAALRRDDLLRLLVRARAARAADADGRVRAGRHRHGAPRALQGQRHRGRPPVAALALPAGLRHVRSRYRLSPARRRGLHQPQRAPAEDPLATRPPGLSVRVGGRAVIMTTSNGTRALLAARGAAAIGVAAFVNLGPAAAWALAGSRDVLLLCSGERGARSLEDHVCAGLLAERLLAGEPGARATAAAEAATAAARPYGKDIARLAHDSSWARHLASRGRAADGAACLSLDAAGIVPVSRAA